MLLRNPSAGIKLMGWHRMILTIKLKYINSPSCQLERTDEEAATTAGFAIATWPSFGAELLLLTEVHPQSIACARWNMCACCEPEDATCSSFISMGGSACQVPRACWMAHLT